MLKRNIFKVLYKLYAFKNNKFRNIILSIICRFDEGEMCSPVLRDIFNDYHNVKIGYYSHGGCFEPNNMDRYTSIGRYCSIARTVKVFNRNHPVSFKSTHAIFYNPAFKFCKNDLISYIPLKIGNDVWIGHNAIILPNVTEISDGAVIAAGAVVNKNIPPYAIVVGNPARVVRFRFSQSKINEIIFSKWWKKDIEELANEIESFQKDCDESENEEHTAV